MQRKVKFNDKWKFYKGELEQAPCTERSKTGACGGAANLTNAEGGCYPMPERFWSMFGAANAMQAGNAVCHMVPELTDRWENVQLPHDFH